MLTTTDENASTLLLTTRETARALSISERTLYAITFPRGTLRAVKLPGKILYSRQTIVAWIAAQEDGSQQPGEVRSHPMSYGSAVET